MLALGVTALLATQTLINLGMVTGLLPVVGIPLPLMSYGGSSMVVVAHRAGPPALDPNAAVPLTA